MDALVDARITAFQEDIRSRDPLTVVQRHITGGSTVALTEDQHHQLRARVAENFEGLHPNDVIVVGSAKLGFSIAPGQRYRPFGDQSDIDIAIVSRDLFEAIWRAAFDYATTGGYWEARARFEHYLSRGWIRPDKLPPIPVAQEWWEFFRVLTNSKAFGPYRIRAGVFHSWHFLETYHVQTVEQCAAEAS
jgi:hypothetical protein